MLLSGFAASTTAQLSAPTQPAVQPAAPPKPAPVAEVGLEFEGVRELNQVALAEMIYQGECPGTDTGEIVARFTSTKTPPAPGRRVVVKAVTRGLGSDPFPYTDREYEKGRASEATRLTFGTRHDGAGLRVLPGENQFEYEIKEGGRVIDAGSFTAQIEKRQQTTQRDAAPRTEQVCANSSVAANVCADLRTRTEYKCPNGNVLRRVFEPNDPNVATLISNQTFSPVYFLVNNEVQSLQPGDSRTYRTSASTYLNLRYNPKCTTCKPDRGFSLQPGKRYRFRSPNSSGGEIQLVDYPMR
jgi:hypothetical protein